ncbi:MAG: hypothetical protein HZA95_02980 [Candidatus Vogelbacteria bacterium]|nr:hypothetical protein [Candidatus Vogelbacteria bacterium]
MTKFDFMFVLTCSNEKRPHLHLVSEGVFDVCIAGVGGQTSGAYFIEMLRCLRLIDEEGKATLYASVQYGNLPRNEFVESSVLLSIRSSFTATLIQQFARSILAAIGNSIFYIPIESFGRGVGKLPASGLLFDHYFRPTFIRSVGQLEQELTRLIDDEKLNDYPENLVTSKREYGYYLGVARTYGLPEKSRTASHTNWWFRLFRPSAVGKAELQGYWIERPDGFASVGFSQVSALAKIDWCEPMSLLMRPGVPNLRKLIRSFNESELSLLDNVGIVPLQLTFGFSGIVETRDGVPVRSFILMPNGETLAEFDYFNGTYASDDEAIFEELKSFDTKAVALPAEDEREESIPVEPDVHGAVSDAPSTYPLKHESVVGDELATNSAEVAKAMIGINPNKPEQESEPDSDDMREMSEDSADAHIELASGNEDEDPEVESEEEANSDDESDEGGSSGPPN